jgi:hypothetical protein
VRQKRVPRILSILLLIVVSASVAGGAIIDQSQTVFSSTNDISQGDRTGQTFTAGISGSLSGIRLVVEGRGFSTSPAFGSDFVLRLRSTASGTPTNTVLAAATVSRSQIEAGTAKWITIQFARPYAQTAGEILAFTIEELSGGGVNGFNDYGQADGNLYSRGQYFSSFTPGQPLAPSTRDFAFQTIVVPELTSTLLLLLGGAPLALARWRKASLRS